MRAKLVNEAIKHLSPKTLEEMLAVLKLDENATINDILIKSVNQDMGNVIQYALDNGANQLWFESGGYLGASQYSYVYENPALFRIVGIKKASGGGEGQFYEKSPFKILYTCVASFDNKTEKFILRNNPPLTTQLFYRKFSPINNRQIKECEKMIDRTKKLINIVNKFNNQ